MKSRCRLPSALAFGLVLASASAARADDSDAALTAAPVTIPTHVLVHIASKSPVQLESRAPGGAAWVAVCGVPCDQELPLADEYRIAYGKKDKPGDAFRLTPNLAGAVVLKVHPKSVEAAVGGGVLVALGGTLAFVSTLGLIAGTAYAVSPPSCGDAAYFCGPALGQGVALVSAFGLLLGGGLLAGGVSVLADAKASTTQKPWAGREPTWVGPQSSAPKKSGLFVPLSLSF